MIKTLPNRLQKFELDIETTSSSFGCCGPADVSAVIGGCMESCLLCAEHHFVVTHAQSDYNVDMLRAR